MPDQRPPDPMFQPPESGRPIPPSADDLHDATAAFDAEQWLMHGLLAVHFDERRADYESDADFARRVRARITEAGSSTEAGPSAGVGPTDDAGPFVDAGPSVDAELSRALTAADEHSPVAAGTESPHVEHATPARVLRLFATRIARRWAIGGGLAAAASVILAVGLVLWSSDSRSAAFAAVATRLALSHLDTVPIDIALAAADPAAREQADASLAVLRAKLDDILAKRAAFDRAVDLSDPEAAEIGIRAEDIRSAWQTLYYALRDAGRFDEALDQCDRAIKFLYRPAWWYFQPVPLYDRGLILAAAGRYAEAREAYQQSIDARRQHLVALGEPDGVAGSARILSPVYMHIADSWLAEGDIREARRALDESKAALLCYMLGVCRANGVDVGAFTADASASGAETESTLPAPGQHAELMAAFRAMPQEFRQPPADETEADIQRWNIEYGELRPNAATLVKLYEHLYREARLHRVSASLARDDQQRGSHLAAARQVLAELCAVWTVQPYTRHDESRLAYYVPLEQARIAIAEREYRAALDNLAEAEQHVNEPDFYGRRLGLAARGELKILRAAALLGANAPSREWRDLLDEALALKQRVCTDGPAAQCNALRPWAKLAEGVR